MMKWLSRSREPVDHETAIWLQSTALPAVEYAIRRVSLAGRIELTEKVRDLVLRREFLQAGGAGDQLEANIADLLVRQLYVQWGLVAIKGLRVNGRRAEIEDVINHAPEKLANEIVEAVKSELGLTDEERKNF
ncbi:MAG: hypothetical protein JO061_23060 [Acidobacteriaceae bacterium]|nr:hypothetical protein [Acidobacteriaceae bacterium]